MRTETFCVRLSLTTECKAWMDVLLTVVNVHALAQKHY